MSRKTSKLTLVGSDGNEVSSRVPGIKECKPCSNTILIEVLTQQEMLGTDMYIPDGNGSKRDGYMSPQAYVIAIGPTCENEKYGFKVGDRVILSTANAVPVPKMDGNTKRDRVIVDPSAIRGVLIES